MNTCFETALPEFNVVAIYFGRKHYSNDYAGLINVC